MFRQRPKSTEHEIVILVAGAPPEILTLESERPGVLEQTSLQPRI